MADKIVAIFAEGPTEIEFYKAVVIKSRELMGTPYSCKIEYVDMKGIGNYKKDALRKFNRLKNKNIDKDISVFLCIDHDVFNLAKKPPFDKNELMRSLYNAGAKEVVYIVAKQSIEEWFLYDMEGIIEYLRLPKSTKRPKGNGQDSIKKLFKLANRLYVKGGRAEGFIEKLNIIKIMMNYCTSLNPLCKALGLNCKKICEK